MALWAGTTINSNETAQAFNRLFQRKSIELPRRKQGILFAVLGETEEHSTPEAGNGWKRMYNHTSGNKIEVKLLGKTPSPSTVSDANQINTATLTFTTDYWGAAEFSLAHYAYTHPIPHSELDRFAGNEAKTEDYLQDVFDLVMLGYQVQWGTAMNTSAAPSRTVLGGYPYAINDSNSYGTIDRSDSGNADYRGLVNSSFGDITIPKLDYEIGRVIINGGDASYANCGLSVWSKIKTILQNYSTVTYDKDWAKFGGKWVQYAGTRFTLD
ncbi:MAG TPA: hypothetical protein PKA27_02325, partial [Fimbriimonadaceae bacterium]|nr:hypothetical protein [Fimbriimonadaceae bacterium]